MVLVDRTASRNSLYDSQAKWRMSARCHWFKGDKLHFGLGRSSPFKLSNLITKKLYLTQPCPPLELALRHPFFIDFNQHGANEAIHRFPGKMRMTRSPVSTPLVVHRRRR